MFLTFSCASKKPQDKGFQFAEKVFDIWKDFTKKEMATENSEISIKRDPLPQSFTMAVYFVPPKKKHQQNWKWSREDKVAFIETLSQTKRTSRVFEMINTIGKEGDLTSLRFMAAQQGAEALLLVQGAAMTETPLNAKALTYLIILPMLFVEGNNVKSTFVTQAVLWNVQKPYVHLGLETEGDWVMERPLIFRQKDRAIEKSKDKSIQELGHKLKMQITRSKL